MKMIASSVLTLALGIWVTPAIGADNKDPGGLPSYDTQTQVDLAGTIVKVNEVTSGFVGVHVTVEAKGGLVEIYLAPAKFVKMLDIPLRAGLKDFAVTGSKVKFEGKDLILAREVTAEKTVFTLRDEKGVPNWLWMFSALPTGL